MLFRDDDEELEVLPFADRGEAGRMLAGKLQEYADRPEVIVLGLPRGGMPVASAVSGALRVPLDVFVVVKIGTPGQPELALGAVAEGGIQVLDLSLVQVVGLEQSEVEEVTEAARRELDSRTIAYRANGELHELAGQMVILVDDGIATGCSILAAIAGTRREGAARVVVAVPVAPASGCNAIRMEADEFVAVAEPEEFLAVSQWYEDFAQVRDEDVRQLLRKAGRIIHQAA